VTESSRENGKDTGISENFCLWLSFME